MCKVTAAAIVADGAAVGTALNNLGEAIQAEDPALATQLENAGKAVIAATQNWQEGSTLAAVEDAEQAAIAVLNAIPLTSAYAPLAAIAFAALNLLIANAQSQPQLTSSAISNAKVMLAKEAQLNTDSPWHDKAKIDHNPFHSPRKNFENTWNKQAAKLNVGTVTV